MGKIKDHYDTKGKQTNGISTTTNRTDKLYMTIQGRKIDQHILETNQQIETQAGFTMLIDSCCDSHIFHEIVQYRQFDQLAIRGLHSKLTWNVMLLHGLM